MDAVSTQDPVPEFATSLPFCNVQLPETVSPTNEPLIAEPVIVSPDLYLRPNVDPAAQSALVALSGVAVKAIESLALFRSMILVATVAEYFADAFVETVSVQEPVPDPAVTTEFVSVHGPERELVTGLPLDAESPTASVPAKGKTTWFVFQGCAPVPVFEVTVIESVAVERFRVRVSDIASQPFVLVVVNVRVQEPVPVSGVTVPPLTEQLAVEATCTFALLVAVAAIWATCPYLMTVGWPIAIV